MYQYYIKLAILGSLQYQFFCLMSFLPVDIKALINYNSYTNYTAELQMVSCSQWNMYNVSDTPKVQ